MHNLFFTQRCWKLWPSSVIVCRVIKYSLKTGRLKISKISGVGLNSQTSLEHGTELSKLSQLDTFKNKIWQISKNNYHLSLIINQVQLNYNIFMHM